MSHPLTIPLYLADGLCGQLGFENNGSEDVAVPASTILGVDKGEDSTVISTAATDEKLEGSSASALEISLDRPRSKIVRIK